MPGLLRAERAGAGRYEAQAVGRKEYPPSFALGTSPEDRDVLTQVIVGPASLHLHRLGKPPWALITRSRLGLVLGRRERRSKAAPSYGLDRYPHDE
jgi:hypothetical protein